MNPASRPAPTDLESLCKKAHRALTRSAGRLQTALALAEVGEVAPRNLRAVARAQRAALRELDALRGELAQLRRVDDAEGGVIRRAPVNALGGEA